MLLSIERQTLILKVIFPSDTTAIMDVIVTNIITIYIFVTSSVTFVRIKHQPKV